LKNIKQIILEKDNKILLLKRAVNTLYQEE